MTSLVRFSPMTELRRLQREMDRLFDTFFGREMEAAEETTPVTWVPRADLAETDDAYLIQLDVPGMNKDELSVTYHDGTLTVSGERKSETKEEKPNYIRSSGATAASIGASRSRRRSMKRTSKPSTRMAC